MNEALETAIYIAEVAKKYGDAWIENAITRGKTTHRTPDSRARRSRWQPMNPTGTARWNIPHGGTFRNSGITFMKSL